MTLSRRIAGWLVTRRALLDELANVERLARDRLIALCASEAARAELERETWGAEEWDALDSLLGTTDKEWPDYESGSDRDVLHRALARHQVRNADA